MHEAVVPEDERCCPLCGRPMRPMGQDITRRLEYVPGHFVEHEHRLEKYGCGVCKEGVTRAAAPPQVLKPSAADASLLAHLVVSKYADHTPLHGCAASTPAAVPTSRSRLCRTGSPASASWCNLWASVCTSGS